MTDPARERTDADLLRLIARDCDRWPSAADDSSRSADTLREIAARLAALQPAISAEAVAGESDWFAGDVDADGNELVTMRADELRKLRDEREKFMWQVRDTCTRAEKAEIALRAAQALATCCVAQSCYSHDELSEMARATRPTFDEALSAIRALAEAPKSEPGARKCDLCAGKCRGHGLADPQSWEPEPGSAAYRSSSPATPESEQGVKAILRFCESEQIDQSCSPPVWMSETRGNAWIAGYEAAVSVIKGYASGLALPTPEPELAGEVVEALEPFANEADRITPLSFETDRTVVIADDCQVWQNGSADIARSRITYGDLRRARALLDKLRGGRVDG